MKNKFLFSVFLGLMLISPAFCAGEDDATLLYNKGIDLYEQDKIEQSIETFKKAIAIDPEFYEAYYNLARIQEAAGKTQDAIASYEKLLKIAPDDYESTYQFGEFLYKKGYLSKSLSYLTKIPTGSEYKSKAEALSIKIKKRQNELAEESRIKAEQELKSKTVGSIPAPSGLVVDNLGDIYVASFSESKIIKIPRDGSTKEVFSDKAKGLDGPIGMAIDSTGNIYVANYNKGNVVLLDKNGVAKTLMFVKKPYGLILDEGKAKLYVTEQQGNSIITYDISDIIKASKKEQENAKADNAAKQAESKPIVQQLNFTDKPSNRTIIESNFTRGTTSGITAPIMIPANDMFD